MTQEEITIQTADEVAQIDYRRLTNDMITTQSNEIQNNIDIISEQLDVIIDNTANSNMYVENTPLDVDLSNVTEMIESIDTSITESNTQDILIKIEQQQEQINEINNKLDLILSKL